MEKIWNEPYKDGLHELVVYYSRLKNPKEMILKFQSIRSIVEGFYQVLVNKKEMDPIESLPKPERLMYWHLTDKKDLSVKERIKASKAIYLMEKILEK